ncbi:MAG: ribbon-helix-helix domain-containing protein [Pseudomonadota bacterium]
MAGGILARSGPAAGGLAAPDAGGGTGPDRTDTPLKRMFALCNTDQTVEYMPVRRSIRLHGHSTTIRLEKAFWVVLEELAEGEGTTLAGLITCIHDHCLNTNQKNLASCLRVVCLKYINTHY